MAANKENIFADAKSAANLAKGLFAFAETLKALAPLGLILVFVGNAALVTNAFSSYITMSYSFLGVTVTPTMSGVVFALIAAAVQGWIYQLYNIRVAKGENIWHWSLIVAGLIAFADACAAVAGWGPIISEFSPEDAYRAADVFPFAKASFMLWLLGLATFVLCLTNDFLYARAFATLSQPDKLKSPIEWINELRLIVLKVAKSIMIPIHYIETIGGFVAMLAMDVALSAAGFGSLVPGWMAQVLGFALWVGQLCGWAYLKKRASLAISAIPLVVVGVVDTLSDFGGATGLVTGKAGPFWPADSLAQTDNLYLCLVTIAVLTAAFNEMLIELMLEAHGVDMAYVPVEEQEEVGSSRPQNTEKKRTGVETSVACRRTSFKDVNLGATLFEAAEGVQFFKVVTKNGLRLIGRQVDEKGRTIKNDVAIDFESQSETVNVVVN